MKTKNKESLNLPAIVRDKRVSIPVKKLNTIEQKQYREYADKVSQHIRTMLDEISEKIIQKHKADMRIQITEKLIKKNPIIGKTYKEYIKLREQIAEVNEESYNIIHNYATAVERLTAEKDEVLATLKNSKMYPLINKSVALINSIKEARVENSALVNPLKSVTVFEREYEFDEDENEDLFNRSAKKSSHKSYRSSEFYHPAITSDDMNLKEVNFLSPVLLGEELANNIDQLIKDFKSAYAKLSKMEQSVKEILLFNEEQMNTAFQQLLAFRDSIQEKHLEIVQEIPPELLIMVEAEVEDITNIKED